MWKHDDFVSIWDRAIESVRVGGYTVAVYPSVFHPESLCGLTIALSDEGGTTLLVSRWGKEPAWWGDEELLNQLPPDVRAAVEELMEEFRQE